MYLRDLSLYAVDDAQMPPERTEQDFNLSTHSPVEAYLDLLPRRQVVLGDLAKVNVAVGRCPARMQPYFAALNVAIIHWPWFDFARYFSLPQAQQQQRIVDVLHMALLRIAERTNSSPTWFETAYAALPAEAFPLPELSEFELRRRWGLLTTAEKKALKRRPRKASRAKRSARKSE